MRICFNEKTIRSHYMCSKSDLLDTLNRKCKKRIVLSEPESYSKCYLLSIQDGCGCLTFGVGLLLICDVPFSILLLHETDCILIGYNQNLALVNCKSQKLIFDLKLDSFFCFAKIYPSKILVLSEMSMYLFSYTGDLINVITFSDILEEYSFDADSFMYTAGSETRAISLREFGAQ